RLAVQRNRVVLQKRLIRDVGALPVSLKAFKLSRSSHKRTLWSQRDRLSRRRRHEVVLPLWVFSLTYQPFQNFLAVDVEFVTQNGNNRNPLAGPISLFQHLIAGHLAPVHRKDLSRALLNKPFRF